MTIKSRQEMDTIEHNEERLLAVCTNLSCLRSFHPMPNTEEQRVLFNELLKRRLTPQTPWVVLYCPACKLQFSIAASILTVCTCGQDPHNLSHPLTYIP